MSVMKMRRLAFLPKTFIQFASRWQILDEVNAEPGVQRALGHSSFHPSIRRSVIITKNFASVRCSCDTFTFAWPLARGWTTCSIPQDEGAVSQGTVCSEPAVLKTNR